MRFYFYFARCADGSLYAGSCQDTHVRELEHNRGKAAKFTAKRRPVAIVYVESFPTLLGARRREKQVKGWTRLKKENLIHHGHPTEFGRP